MANFSFWFPIKWIMFKQFPLSWCIKFRQSSANIGISDKTFYPIIWYCIVSFYLFIRFILQFPVNDCIRLGQHVHQTSIRCRQYFWPIGVLDKNSTLLFYQVQTVSTLFLYKVQATKKRGSNWGDDIDPSHRFQPICELI